MAYDKQTIDIDAIKEQYFAFQTCKNEIFMNMYNLFHGGYLNHCSDIYVNRVSNKIKKELEEMKISYENILKWWTSYNDNASSLELFLSQKGNYLGLMEGNLSQYMTKHIVPLQTRNHLKNFVPSVTYTESTEKILPLETSGKQKITTDASMSSVDAFLNSDLYKNSIKKLNNLKDNASIIMENSSSTVNNSKMRQDINGYRNPYLIRQEIHKVEKEIDKFSNASFLVGNVITNFLPENARKEIEKQNSIRAYKVKLDKELYEAERAEKTHYYSSMMKEKDFEEYASKGANIKNPSYKEAMPKVKIFGWEPVDEKIQNKVQFSVDNAKEIIDGKRNQSEISTTIQNEQLRLIHLNPIEVKIYNYILAKKGEQEADKFIEYLEDTINYRMGREQAQAVENATAIGKPIVTASTAFSNGLENFGKGLQQLTQDEAVVTSPTQYGASMVRENIKTTPAKMAYDVVNGIGYMAPSIAVSGLTGGLGASANVAGASGAISMGLAAGGNTYNDDLKQGYSKDMAKNHAIASGVTNTVTQYGIGGISSLGGVATKKLAAKLGVKITSNAGKVLANMGTSALGEGVEESLQQGIEPLIRNSMLYEDNKINIKDIAYAGTIGAITSSVLNMPNQFQNIKLYRDMEINGLVEMSVDSQIDNNIKNLDNEISSIQDNQKITVTSKQNVIPKNMKLSPIKLSIGILFSPLTFSERFHKIPITKNYDIFQKSYQEGIYHITKNSEVASQIINSGYVKSSDIITSYGAPSAFFFAGIPSFDEVCLNIDNAEITMTAVKIKPTYEQLSEFMTRPKVDNAVFIKGNFDMKNNQVETVTLGLDIKDNQLYYKEIAPSDVENYKIEFQKNHPQINKVMSSNLNKLCLTVQQEYKILMDNFKIKS